MSEENKHEKLNERIKELDAYSEKCIRASELILEIKDLEIELFNPNSIVKNREVKQKRLALLTESFNELQIINFFSRQL
jgi:hypothetical protein